MRRDRDGGGGVVAREGCLAFCPDDRSARAFVLQTFDGFLLTDRDKSWLRMPPQRFRTHIGCVSCGTQKLTSDSLQHRLCEVNL